MSLRSRFNLAAAFLLWPSVAGLSWMGTLPPETWEGLLFTQPWRPAVWTAATLHIRDEQETLRRLANKRVTWRMVTLPQTAAPSADEWGLRVPFAHGVAHGGQNALKNATQEATISHPDGPFSVGITLGVEGKTPQFFTCAATTSPESPQMHLRRVSALCLLAR